MPVNKINPNVPSVGATQTQASNGRAPAPMSGANSFASKLASKQSPGTAQQKSASMQVETQPTPEEKMEAMRDIMKQQSLSLSQQIMASGGNAPKPDSE